MWTSHPRNAGRQEGSGSWEWKWEKLLCLENAGWSKWSHDWNRHDGRWTGMHKLGTQSKDFGLFIYQLGYFNKPYAWIQNEFCLQIANPRKYHEYHIEKFGYKESNTDFLQGYIEIYNFCTNYFITLFFILKYSKSCLISPAIEEEFCVWIDRTLY